MTLSDYMALRGIDDAGLAALLGDCSESGVRKWRYGERVPRPEQMKRIAEVTAGAVTPNDFVLGKGRIDGGASCST